MEPPRPPPPTTHTQIPQVSGEGARPGKKKNRFFTLFSRIGRQKDKGKTPKKLKRRASLYFSLSRRNKTHQVIDDLAQTRRLSEGLLNDFIEDKRDKLLSGAQSVEQPLSPFDKKLVSGLIDTLTPRSQKQYKNKINAMVNDAKVQREVRRTRSFSNPVTPRELSLLTHLQLVKPDQISSPESRRKINNAVIEQLKSLSEEELGSLNREDLETRIYGMKLQGVLGDRELTEEHSKAFQAFRDTYHAMLIRGENFFAAKYRFFKDLGPAQDREISRNFPKTYSFLFGGCQESILNLFEKSFLAELKSQMLLFYNLLLLTPNSEEIKSTLRKIYFNVIKSFEMPDLYIRIEREENIPLWANYLLSVVKSDHLIKEFSQSGDQALGDGVCWSVACKLAFEQQVYPEKKVEELSFGKLTPAIRYAQARYGTEFEILKDNEKRLRHNPPFGEGINPKRRSLEPQDSLLNRRKVYPPLRVSHNEVSFDTEAEDDPSWNQSAETDEAQSQLEEMLRILETRNDMALDEMEFPVKLYPNYDIKPFVIKSDFSSLSETIIKLASNELKSTNGVFMISFDRKDMGHRITARVDRERKIYRVQDINLFSLEYRLPQDPRLNEGLKWVIDVVEGLIKCAYQETDDITFTWLEIKPKNIGHLEQKN